MNPDVALIKRRVARPIGFANGCFDLFHAGHATFLKMCSGFAKQSGIDMFFVVAVNGDESVRSLKPGRPIIPERDRLTVVGSNRSVDSCILFNELRVTNLIQELRPSYWFKSGYRLEDIHPEEKAAAEQVGTKIILFGRVGCTSTSNIIASIRAKTAECQSPGVRASGIDACLHPGVP